MCICAILTCIWNYLCIQQVFEAKVFEDKVIFSCDFTSVFEEEKMQNQSITTGYKFVLLAYLGHLECQRDEK